MPIRPAGFPAVVFLACLVDLPPSVAQADPIPNITVTTATGYVGFTYNGTSGGLYGPDASINTDYGNAAGVLFFSALIGSSFSPYFQLPPLDAVPFSILNGSVTVGGQTYGWVSADGYANVASGVSVTVPAGYASVQFPATFYAEGTACLDISGFFSCSPPPPLVPTVIADVGFDVPGILTVNFSPPPGPLPGWEVFDAEFDPSPFPVPEPSSALLVLFALTAIAIWRIVCAKACRDDLKAAAEAGPLHSSPSPRIRRAHRQPTPACCQLPIDPPDRLRQFGGRMDFEDLAIQGSSHVSHGIGRFVTFRPWGIVRNVKEFRRSWLSQRQRQ